MNENRKAFLLALADLMEKHGVEIGKITDSGHGGWESQDLSVFEFPEGPDFEVGFWNDHDGLREDVGKGQ
jgi:hypothetical protein